MDYVALAVALAGGIILGVALTVWLRRGDERRHREMADALFRQAESQQKDNVEAVLDHVRSSFSELSLQALSQSTDEFLKLARERLALDRQATSQELDSKKGLIDQRLNQITKELENLATVAKDLEKDRVEKFGALTNQLKAASEQTARLTQTTNSLREALASSRARGQWGERMAEDVLRMAGFTENINYYKQRTIEGERTRPDFTFPLPNDLVLNMDVKFSLDNYLRYLDAEEDVARNSYRTDFIRDVKARVKEVASRGGYIDPGNNTVDYALMFIPNEQIYAFIHEQDATLLDDAIRNKVVICSPVTLFAILAVIRQAVDNFAFEQTSREILSLLGAFKKQWDMFVGKMDIVGKRIGDAQKEFELLSTTRQRQLERPLQKIEELRNHRGLPIADDSRAGLDTGELEDHRGDR